MAALYVLAVITPLVAGAMGVGAFRALLATRALYPAHLAARHAGWLIAHFAGKRLEHRRQQPDLTSVTTT